MCAIKIFCKFIANRETCFTENYLKILKIEKLKEEIKPIEYIQQKDIDILFSLPDVSKKKGRRDLFLMELMYATAAREDEISKLTIDSFITNNNNVSIKLIGKGNKTRFVPIDDKLYEKLKIYISDFNICKNDPLFNSTIHNKKVPISKSSIYKIINSYSEKLSQKSETSPKSIWPHLLRHSRAMYWYTNGISLDIIAQLLGHSQVETTLIYAYADTEMKRKALEKIDSTDSANNNHELSLLDEEEIIMKLSALR